MKLTYQTGVATFIQFIVVSLFTLLSQTVSTVSSCHQDGRNCLINIITAIIFYIVVAVFFGIVWLIGYFAQNRRSKRWAQFLICTEAFLGLLALFSIKLNSHTRNAFGLFASFGMLLFSAWIISLAFRLMRSGGGRVRYSRDRPRQRPTH